MGAGFRGGGWFYEAFIARLSSRHNAAVTDTSRISSSGGRGVRSAP
jgi:hypothetical protein